MFVSVNGKAKEVKEIFAGGTDGLAHKVNEMFGSVDGTAKLVYSSASQEHNAFDDFTWAEIKQLADEGQLLKYFKKGDSVTIKLTQPLVGRCGLSGEYEFYQDTLIMKIAEITSIGMRLVCSIATPGRFYFRIDNETFLRDIKDSGQGGYMEKGIWGLCSGLYDKIKAIDNALPEDLRDVLVSFNPLYKYEYYIDEEDKKRLRKEYDDCRVQQVSKCGYEYHNEFVEENNRNEYILDYTDFVRKESAFKRFIPEAWRYQGWDICYGIDKVQYRANVDGWYYTLIFNDPDISWKWDWENYDNRNKFNKMPTYTDTTPDDSVICPEMVIGNL